MVNVVAPLNVFLELCSTLLFFLGSSWLGLAFSPGYETGIFGDVRFILKEIDCKLHYIS